ncbi:MAG: undecaprenyldiphospho-muramoylpentapeptide beta-N-acetylglucosaminyltransferase [Actinomycetia bacterium]|nr:undecaprenyldiphospho-muramoylpentapeptide beta-N-acetylglucosaminyltransferase [Actinomycetes bacterium]
MRFLLSGGGTAGHIYPALTVAGLLAEGGHDEVLFVGTPDGPEARLVPEAGVAFAAVASAGFDRGNPLTLMTSGIRVLTSVVAAWKVLRRFHPDAVVGFGGYVSLPVGIAAFLSRTPLVLHEQNSVPGLANRVLSRCAREVGVTYENSIKHLKHPNRATLTGNPVRPAILSATRASGREALDLDPAATVVLVFGGSRGARHLNEALARLWPVLAAEPELQVVHVAGTMDAAAVAEAMAQALDDPSHRYRLYEYVSAMGEAIAAADVVVARAGATSIAEITAIGRAAVLVPYPFATDDHQTLNARAVAAGGGAMVVPDDQLEMDAFESAVMSLVRDRARRETMAAASAALGRRDAGERLVEMIRRAAAPRR